MASVYAATHRNKKRVAVKMLHPELSSHEGLRKRFMREGYVANTVEHPGAVAVLDDDVAEWTGRSRSTAPVGGPARGRCAMRCARRRARCGASRSPSPRSVHSRPKSGPR